MDHTIEELSPVKRKISISVPAAGVNAILDATIRNFGQDLSLDGFRKGKVPPKVIESRFGEEIINRATDTLVNMQVSSLLEEKNINPITRIQFEGEKIARDTDFSFSFSFEILPEIPLPENLEELSVEVQGPDLKPEDVEAITRRLRQAMATLEEVTENRLPQDGDVVLVDVDGTFEGKPVPGMKADNFLMQLKSSENPMEVDTIIRKLHVGETLNDTLICPEDYPDPTLRGKNLDVKVTLHKIQTEVPAEMDEEFAKRVGFEDLGKMRKAIFEQALNNKLTEVKAAGQKKLLDSILEPLDFPLPESMVNNMLAEYLNEARVFLQRQGIDPETMTETLKNMRDEGLEQAKAQAKIQAFLLSLAFRENIKVSEQEADRQIREMASESGQDYLKLRDQLWQTGLIHDVQERIMAGKAMDLLYNKAKKIVVDENGTPLPPPEVVTDEAAIQKMMDDAE